jgi:fatty-acyl-CoA synthase
MTPPTNARSVKALFDTSLRRYADRIAVSVDGTDVTYGELDERANAVAKGLVNRGVEPEDRVGILTSNCLEYVLADLALVKAGAAKVPLNDMLTPDEFEYILDDAGVETVVCGPAFVDTVDDLRSSLDALETVIAIDSDRPLPDGFEPFADLDGFADTPPEVSPAPDAVAGHYYTGGTTGKPKGVIHTQEGLAMAMYSHIIEIGISGDDTMLLMTPLPHSAGAFLWAGLLTGAHAIVHDGFEPTRALENIETHDVTWTFMVPTMIYRLLDHEELQSTETDSLSTLAYGAAPMTPARLREGLDVFGPIFLQFYGQTEVPNVITTLGKAEHRLAIENGDEHRLSSAGQPCLMSDVRIADPETGDPVEPGNEGEILATAPYAMTEYFERPEKTAETLVDGWVRTGDIGRIDEDGYVYLLDRASNMIITGGMNVYSTEVEEVLDEHPEIQQVAVIGTPDDEWGELVTAIVVPHDDADVTDADIMTFADDRLADYKRPKRVEFIDDIPKTPYGKMDKKALRDPYWQDAERDIG